MLVWTNFIKEGQPRLATKYLKVKIVVQLSFTRQKLYIFFVAMSYMPMFFMISLIIASGQKKKFVPNNRGQS